MAIKIVSEGNPFEIACSQCECVFQFEEEDVEKKVFNYSFTNVHLKRVIYCPTCGKRFKLSDGKCRL